MHRSMHRLVPRLPHASAVHMRMAQALVAFTTLMVGIAVGVAQTLTPDQPGVAPPAPQTAPGFQIWWFLVAIVIIAAIWIGVGMMRSRRTPR